MDGDRLMRAFVAFFVHGFAYLPAKITSRYGKGQHATLSDFYNGLRAKWVATGLNQP